jgi:hypothetical protein
VNFENLSVGEHVWTLKAQEQLKISMEVLTKLWRIDIDGKLELEIDMVYKMFKRKSI